MFKTNGLIVKFSNFVWLKTSLLVEINILIWQFLLHVNEERKYGAISSTIFCHWEKFRSYDVRDYVNNGVNKHNRITDFLVWIHWNLLYFDIRNVKQWSKKNKKIKMMESDLTSFLQNERNMLGNKRTERNFTCVTI